jgi:hypothetical protein
MRGDKIKNSPSFSTIGARAALCVISLAAAASFAIAGDASAPPLHFAQGRSGNCPSDCDWNAIRCSGDCGEAGEAHFLCSRKCVAAKAKCMMDCSKKETLYKIVDDRNSASPDGPGPAAATRFVQNGKELVQIGKELNFRAAAAR